MAGAALPTRASSTRLRTAIPSAIQGPIDDPIQPLDLDPVLRVGPLAVAQNLDQVGRDLPAAVGDSLDQLVASRRSRQRTFTSRIDSGETWRPSTMTGRMSSSRRCVEMS